MHGAPAAPTLNETKISKVRALCSWYIYYYKKILAKKNIITKTKIRRASSSSSDTNCALVYFLYKASALASALVQMLYWVGALVYCVLYINWVPGYIYYVKSLAWYNYYIITTWSKKLKAPWGPQCPAIITTESHCLGIITTESQWPWYNNYYRKSKSSMRAPCIFDLWEFLLC